MNKVKELYLGKAKTMYTTEDKSLLVCEFRNDTSAFNGEKVEKLNRKGLVNNYFNAFIMQKLSAHGVPTHFIERLNDTESLVKTLKMIPLECVVRNVASGGLSKRLGIENGVVMKPPIFEFFLKDDSLGDPMVNESHIETFKWATAAQVAKMKEMTFRVNEILAPLFAEAGMLLVDYKLEFGLDRSGHLLLGDEFSPDGCRIWDAETKEILDKDRFRKNLGQVVEGYEIAAKRLGVPLP
ncbi:MAG: phosphoribosylaminoimidazolesuccinocarboxamide synthase [Gammaproteobacteria bacterium]